MSAETIIFRGAYLRYLDFRKAEPGWFCRLHMTADYTTNVAEAMGWGAPSNGLTDGGLEGELIAQNLILTPNEKPLERNEIQLDAESVGTFKFVRVENEGSASEELRFIVKTSVVGAAGIIEDYVRRIGQSASQLRISYAKQEQLPLQPAQEQEDEDGAGSHCDPCEAGTPLAAGTLMHINGEPCVERQAATGEEADEPKANGGPALISATQMGGTHQRGGKKRQPQSVN